ncbi:hypothetical protein DL770_005408 [Monosporascus sp. CRB-9-2]|nr:hypothetical protein DL770_005408 [Monosporascus sp. CRB-9-2]
MTRLHGPRDWLGYFVGCESEAMYHIYSLEKYKASNWFSRVEDGEGQDDPQDTPSWKTESPPPDVEVPDHLASESEAEASGDEDSYRDDNERSANTTRIRAEHASQRTYQPVTDTTHQSQVELEEADDEDKDDVIGARHAVMSKYFDQFRHADVARRKIGDNTEI